MRIIDYDTKKAIRILEEQKGRLTSARNKHLVVMQTLDFVEKFLGKESNHYALIKSFSSFPSIEDRDYEMKVKVSEESFAMCIDATVDTIRKIGLKKSAEITKTNLVAHLNNWQVLGLVVVIYTAGFGTYKAIEEIKSTAVAPSNIVPTKVSNADSNQKANQKSDEKSSFHKNEDSAR